MGAYDKVTAALMALSVLDRFKLYSGASYRQDGTLEQQAGFGEGGVDANFTAYNADFAAVVEMAQALAAQIFGANPPRTVTRLSATSFAEAGNHAAEYTARRAVVLGQTTPGVGHVVSASYNAGASRTEVVVEDIVVDAGLTQAVLGIDPAYAPRLDTYVGATATTAGRAGQLPAPQAGDQDKIPYCDGTRDWVRPWSTIPRGVVGRTSDSTFNVLDNAASQALFCVRRPLRFRANSGTAWGAASYAYVISYAAGVVTIGGAPLTAAIAGDSGFEIQFGDMLRLVQVRDFFPGLFSVAYGATDLCFGSGGTAIATDYYSSLVPANAFDGNLGTYWQRNTGTSGYIGYHFTAAKNVAAYKLITGPLSSPQLPVSWTFEGSNDGSNWTTLDTRTGQALGQYDSRIYTCTAGSYAYYRLNVTSNGGGVLALAGLEMYAATSMNLFANKYGHAFRWFQGRAHLARLAVRPRMDDSGALQPTVNVTIGGVPALTAALSVNDASFAASAATVDPVAAALSSGSDIELVVTGGTNNDGLDLDAMLLFILE
ncbi:MAG: discoidin domain-containing protein [Acidobacteriota bacterium]